jgi:hypothetical protein
LEVFDTLGEEIPWSIGIAARFEKYLDLESNYGARKQVVITSYNYLHFLHLVCCTWDTLVKIVPNWHRPKIWLDLIKNDGDVVQKCPVKWSC